MRIEIVSHQVSLVGKVKEQASIESTLADFYQYLYSEKLSNGLVFDNSVLECDLVDLGFVYDQSDYTVKQIKQFWKEYKSK